MPLLFSLAALPVFYDLTMAAWAWRWRSFSTFLCDRALESVNDPHVHGLLPMIVVFFAFVDRIICLQVKNRFINLYGG